MFLLKKTTLKIYVISKQSLWWFSTASTSSFSYSSLKLSLSHLLLPPPCFSELSPFEPSQVTSSWSKQQEFKIQTNKII
jgi:hypothetical protein